MRPPACRWCCTRCARSGGPRRIRPAHLAELVCSNSFRSDDWATNAVGLLHEEMRRAGSLIMAAADRHKLPAGGALAVDREGFAGEVTRRLEDQPLVAIVREEIGGLPPADWDSVIVATGPLTSPALARAVQSLTGEAELAFFDAIAPIVHRDTIDMGVCWLQSRYDKEGPGGGTARLHQLPARQGAVRRLHRRALSGEKTSFKEWEASTPYFEGCLPIEVMAERGRETLAYGPMKPVGLTNPHRPERPYAVVQLRQDNALGSLWNMVGFQTKLKHAEQVRIFRTVPGLEQAEFARLGGLHRNTFLNSPVLLDQSLRLKADARLRFAGQITGVEGYVESAAIGLLAGRFAAAERLGTPLLAAATHHGAWRASQSHHRRASASGSDGQLAQLPADERQFRAVPSPRRPAAKGKERARQQDIGAQACARDARARRSRALARGRRLDRRRVGASHAEERKRQVPSRQSR